MAMAKGLKLDGMKVGQKITLTYTQSGKTMDATAFEPAT